MIKEKIVEYRNQNPDSRTLLGTVIGELDRITKTPTDGQCIQVIKKMIESNIECNQTQENKILELFIPQQLDELDIKNILSHYNFTSIGECMKHFKEHHAGLYDGKLVSKLFNSK